MMAYINTKVMKSRNIAKNTCIYLRGLTSSENKKSDYTKRKLQFK